LGARVLPEFTPYISFGYIQLKNETIRKYFQVADLEAHDEG